MSLQRPPVEAIAADPGMGAQKWIRAIYASALLALDPRGLGGASLRTAPSSVRDRWIEDFKALADERSAYHRLPASICAERLIGGLDLAATLGAGRPVMERGLLAHAHDGVVVAAMAERIEPGIAAVLSSALDSGVVRVERDGFREILPACFTLIMLDEGFDPDERPPAALLERVAFHIDLEGVSNADSMGFLFAPADIESARSGLGAVEISDAMIEAINAASLGFGVPSLRALYFAIRAARAAAALAGRDSVSEEDATLACSLVFSPRASHLPADPQQADQDQANSQPEDPSSQSDGEPTDDRRLEDKIVDAVRIAIPADVLARLQAGQSTTRSRGAGGKAGALRKSLRKGRPFGSRRGDPGSGGRLKLVDTLRSAAPWQRLRGRTSADQRIAIRREDFRIARFRERQQTLTIFVVDASGSSAMQRLNEAKGAIEVLLGQCYARRDEVALIAFRQKGAEMVLAPTRSLVRAQRGLADLPGGGGTPLAAGIEAAALLAIKSAARARTPTVVILTDGRANVALDGEGGRPRAQEDAIAASRRLRATGCRTLLFDISPRSEPLAKALADEIGARYAPLPFADPAALTAAIRAGGAGPSPGSHR